MPHPGGHDFCAAHSGEHHDLSGRPAASEACDRDVDAHGAALPCRAGGRPAAGFGRAGARVTDHRVAAVAIVGSIDGWRAVAIERAYLSAF